MKNNCCKNCVNAQDYTGWEAHYCIAFGCCIRGEQYDCKKFIEEDEVVENLE